MFDVQANPSYWVPVLTGGLALLLVLSGSPWRLARNLVTIVHEAGHALVAVLAGRRLEGIRLHSDTSGVTVSRGKPEGPGMVLTSLAGYSAPAVLGLAFAALVALDRITVLLGLAALLLLGVLVMVRNAYGVLSVVVTAAGLAVLALVAGEQVQSWFVYLITWFLLLGAIRPVVELQRKRRRGAAHDSDVDQLARLTGVPPALWLLILGVLALSCVLIGAAWLLEPALKS
ncbi:MAG TPA: M50 family metallopeptidase [Amycolatopsis sp.]|nr:M50 family metallopeptidase [Amycolatopsis sp.]